MNRLQYEQRRERLRDLMRQKGFSLLLISHAANRYYLSGFELHDPQLNESAGRLVIAADGKDWICTDARYVDAARRLWDEERILVYGAEAAGDMGKLLAGLLPGQSASKEEGGGRIGFEAGIVTLEFYEHFAEAVGAGNLSRADGMVESLRQIKDADEIRRMEASCRLNHQLMEWLPSILLPGRKESEIAWAIETFFRERGASELAFASIVGRGTNAALPHYIPSETEVFAAEDLVLVDVGARLGDYCSDQTRTFRIGNGTPAWADAFQRTLDAVREAQRRAIAFIRPGVAACDVYQVARQYFEELGVAAAFTHGLGHGIGLETHEGPSLNSRNATRLQPGMVVTVEPGLYYPEWGGVRWEYMVLVTEDGCRTLSPA